MDRVFIRGLVAETIVGVHDWEQQAPRKVVITLDMAVDIRTAAASDSIDDTVSYCDVTRRIIALLGSSRTFLLETLAERIAKVVLSEFAVSSLSLEIQKPGAVPEAETVGVCIERSRE